MNRKKLFNQLIIVRRLCNDKITKNRESFKGLVLGLITDTSGVLLTWKNTFRQHGIGEK